LSGYESPTLLFSAENDLFFPAERVIPRAREVIPHIETETLPNDRHVPSREAFAEINDRIAAFLRPT
jgi:pimeloyl-ACP methyl ester carboxylesterase